MKKIMEQEFNSDDDLQSMDFQQDDMGNKDMGSEERDPNEQLGSLGFILGSLIAGTSSPERAMDMVQSSNVLGSSMKEMIMKVVEDEKGRLSRGPKFEPVVDDEDEMNEFVSLNEGKKRLVRDFKRYV
jgi:hypothetical protein